MATYARIEIAIAQAMETTPAGAAIAMEPLMADVTSAIRVLRAHHAHNAMDGAERAYCDRMARDGSRRPHGYHLTAVHPDGVREWVGDLHIHAAPGCTPIFFLMYAA